MSLSNKRSSTTQKLKRGRRNRVGKKRLNVDVSSAGTVWKIPRQIGFPDATRTKMRYIIPLAQVLGGGTTNSLRYTSNAYDVDAALGSTAMPYFAEMAAVYSRFRTLSMTYHFSVSNSEAFPNAMIHGFSTTSLGSTALGQNYSGGPYISTVVCSPINGSTSSRTFHRTIRIDKLFGTTQALFDDLFTGSTTASTLSSSATGYAYIGSVSAAVPVAGWFVTGWIELDLLFDKRNSLFS